MTIPADTIHARALDAIAVLMADQVLPDVRGAVLAMHKAGKEAGLPAGWYLDTLDAWCDEEGATRALERIATDWEMPETYTIARVSIPSLGEG